MGVVADRRGVPVRLTLHQISLYQTIALRTCRTCNRDVKGELILKEINVDYYHRDYIVVIQWYAAV